MFDDRPQRIGREVGQRAHDQDHSNQQAHEQRTRGGKGAQSRRYDPLLDQRTAEGQYGNEKSEAADQHGEAPRPVVELRVASDAGEGRAIVAVTRCVEVENLREPMWAGIEDRTHSLRDHAGHRGKAQDRSGQDEQRQRRHHDLFAFDLLAQVLRGAPHHQPRDKDRDDGKHQHSVEPRAYPSEDDLAERDVGQRDHATNRRVAIVEAVDRPARGHRRGHGEDTPSR